MNAPSNIYFSCLPRTNAGKIFNNIAEVTSNQKPVTHHFDTEKKPGTVLKSTTKNYKLNKLTPPKSFTQQLLQAQEQERQELARELHDNLGQSLVVIKNNVLTLKNKAAGNPNKLAELNNLAELLAAALQKIRQITYDLHPYELQLLGLTPALQSLAEQFRFLMPGIIQTNLPNLNQVFTTGHEIFIYRIIQECFNIIQKQPDVTGIWFTAQQRQTAVQFELQVQGASTFFSYMAANFLKNYDLLRLQELLELAAGTLTFRASGNRHTTLEIKIPLK